MTILKFKSTNLNGQKGVALFLVVMIISIILAIGMGLNTIVIQQNRMMTEIGNSVIAFYAADNGIEEIMALDTPTAGNFEYELSNGAESQVTVSPEGSPGCEAINFCIKSIGTYGKTKRAIEIQY